MIASDFVFVCVSAENRVFERLVLVGVDETQDDGFSVFLLRLFKGYDLSTGRMHRENTEFESRAGVSVNIRLFTLKSFPSVCFSPHLSEVSQLLCMCFPCSTELVYYPTGRHWLPIHWEDWGLRRTNLMSKGRRERWREVKDESEVEGGVIMHFKIPLTLKKE